MTLTSFIKALFVKPESWFQGELEQSLTHFADLMREKSNFVLVDSKKRFKDKGISRYAVRADLEIGDLIIAMRERGYNYQVLVGKYDYRRYLDEYNKIMGSGENRPIMRYLQ